MSSRDGRPIRRWASTKRLASVLMLGASVGISAGPAWARPAGGGGFQGGGGFHGGGAAPMRGGWAHPSAAPPMRGAPPMRAAPPVPAAPPVRAAPAPEVRAVPPAPAVRSGRTGVYVNRPATAPVYRGRDVYVHRNTWVRPAPRPYVRAPYVYGGRRYYAYHPYAYHRYQPFFWGPAFVPFGVFVGALAASAIVVTVADQPYRYDQGVWYLPTNGGYAAVTAPIGATVPGLPPGATSVAPGVYYYAGAYYQWNGGGYTVVAPQAGTVVNQLPPGGEEITIGN